MPICRPSAGRHTESNASCSTGSNSAHESNVQSYSSVSVLTNIYKNTTLANIGGKRLNVC